MLGGEVTVGWQAGRTRLPVLPQTQRPPVSAGGSVRGCICPAPTPSLRGPNSSQCPSVSLTPIFVSSEQEGIPQLWLWVWGQRLLARSLSHCHFLARWQHLGLSLAPPLATLQSDLTWVQVVAHQGLLGGVLGSQVGSHGSDSWCVARWDKEQHEVCPLTVAFMWGWGQGAV